MLENWKNIMKEDWGESEMIKKIGVINCSHISNFGSVLQSFAIEKVVREITGYETYSIRYKHASMPYNYCICENTSIIKLLKYFK